MPFLFSVRILKILCSSKHTCLQNKGDSNNREKLDEITSLSRSPCFLSSASTALSRIPPDVALEKDGKELVRRYYLTKSVPQDFYNSHPVQPSRHLKNYGSQKFLSLKQKYIKIRKQFFMHTTDITLDSRDFNYICNNLFSSRSQSNISLTRDANCPIHFSQQERALNTHL